MNTWNGPMESGNAAIPCNFSIFLPLRLWPPACYPRERGRRDEKLQPKPQRDGPRALTGFPRRFYDDRHNPNRHGDLPGQ